MEELLLLMKSELMITLIIFILLLIKLGKGMKNATLLSLVQVLLLVSIGLALVENREGSLFDGMFLNGTLIGYQKAILSFAVYLISLLFSGWLRKSDNLTEFLVLMLSALLGMFFMISSGNLLMFYLSLELATIPGCSHGQFRPGKEKVFRSCHEDDSLFCFFIRYLIVWYFTDLWYNRHIGFC